MYQTVMIDMFCKFAPNPSPQTGFLFTTVNVISITCVVNIVEVNVHPPPCSLGVRRSSWFTRNHMQHDILVWGKKTISQCQRKLLTSPLEEILNNAIDQATQLALSQGIHMNRSSKTTTNPISSGSMPGGGDEWESWRRVWRSMVFLDG